MPNFHMMIGIPASGKSTIEDKLLNTHSSRTVSTDNIISAVAKATNTTYDEMHPHVIDFASKLEMHMLKHHIAKGHDVICDQTNLTKKSRARKIAVVPKHYYKVAHVVHTPPKEEHERRLASREGKTIPKNVLENMKASYQAPTHEEGFHEINHYDHAGKLISTSKQLNHK